MRVHGPTAGRQRQTEPQKKAGIGRSPFQKIDIAPAGLGKRMTRHLQESVLDVPLLLGVGLWPGASVVAVALLTAFQCL